jgi:hypothetical protein
MKLATELLKASFGLPDGKSYRTLTRPHEGTLYAFYCSLNPEERRARFGGAVSDEAIARHCDGIDWRSTLIVVFGTAFRLDAVAVNVRIDGRRVENVTVATGSGEQAVPTLLRLSAVATRDLFAAERMMVSLDGASWLLRHLREIGPTEVKEDYAEFDVSSISGEADAFGDERAFRTRMEQRAACR